VDFVERLPPEEALSPSHRLRHKFFSS